MKHQTLTRLSIITLTIFSCLALYATTKKKDPPIEVRLDKLERDIADLRRNNDIRPDLDRVPIGTVAAWLGALPPTNWAICNGQEIRPSWKKIELQTVLGGDADHLPDLQGYFLRGFDPRQLRDKGPRSALSVGSSQKDTVGNHGHNMNRGISVRNGGNGGQRNILQRTDSRDRAIATDATVSPETRPMNIAVHWIMRVK